MKSIEINLGDNKIVKLFIVPQEYKTLRYFTSKTTPINPMIYT